MKETTSITVPGTTVKITIMKTMEGKWNVMRSAQLGIATAVDTTFPGDSQYAAKIFADVLWTQAVEARNDQISRADTQAYSGFASAQSSGSYITEVRFDD